MPSALPSDPELYRESQGQGWGSGAHLLSCCCWRLMPLISHPTIPGAICPEAFRLSMRRRFWIRPSALCFMRPWAITGNGQGTSDLAQCRGQDRGFGVKRPRSCVGWCFRFLLSDRCLSPRNSTLYTEIHMPSLGNGALQG